MAIDLVVAGHTWPLIHTSTPYLNDGASSKDGARVPGVMLKTIAQVLKRLSIVIRPVE